MYPPTLRLPVSPGITMARRNRRHGWPFAGATDQGVRVLTIYRLSTVEIGAKRLRDLTVLKGEKWYNVFLAAKALDRRVATPPEPDPYCVIPKRKWNEVRCPCPLQCLYMHMSDHPLHGMCSYQQHVFDMATTTRV